MSKTAIVVVLAGFVLNAAGSTSASAMQIVPLPKSVLTNLSGEIVDAGWRRCWWDRWGAAAVRGAGATVGGGSAADSRQLATRLQIRTRWRAEPPLPTIGDPSKLAAI
jgi:hypothetical protein